MKHAFIDRYSDRDSILHRLDPRSKLLICFMLLVYLSAVNAFAPLLPVLAFFAFCAALSRVPAWFLLQRILLVLPLLVVLGLLIFISFAWENPDGGFFHQPQGRRLLLMVGKTILAVLLLSLLTSVTRFRGLLWAMRRLGLPRIITTLSTLLYTYLFILVDEIHRSLRARRSRAGLKLKKPLQSLGYVAGTIFLRGLNRADTVYKAMTARGFRGEFPDSAGSTLRPADGLAFSLALVLAVLPGVLWKLLSA